MSKTVSAPWKVSLHGGHSGEFCDHAEGTLREVLEAALRWGYHTFGVSEHAPRAESRFLYETEREMSWDLNKILRDFERYARTVDELSAEYAGRLQVLRGFEAEVVPASRYVEIMTRYRRSYPFDYMVGSVHYVDEVLIDGPMEWFEQAVAQQGGVEPLAVRYYETLADMIETLRPEVVGHFDIIQKNAGPAAALDTPAIRRAALRALEAARTCDAILDVNTAGYRKGLGRPYPAPWLVHEAQRMGLGFCFGDDSHGPGQAGLGILDARAYLMELGVSSLTVLTREEGAIVRKAAPL